MDPRVEPEDDVEFGERQTGTWKGPFADVS
jgi:hypothetical protein